MKHMKTVELPATKKEVVDCITCDLCGEAIIRFARAPHPYSVDRATVEHNLGERYPEGGHGNLYEFDICGKCFQEKIIHWMKSQGAEPRVENWYL